MKLSQKIPKINKGFRTEFSVFISFLNVLIYFITLKNIHRNRLMAKVSLPLKCLFQSKLKIFIGRYLL